MPPRNTGSGTKHCIRRAPRRPGTSLRTLAVSAASNCIALELSSIKSPLLNLPGLWTWPAVYGAHIHDVAPRHHHCLDFSPLNALPIYSARLTYCARCRLHLLALSLPTFCRSPEG